MKLVRKVLISDVPGAVPPEDSVGSSWKYTYENRVRYVTE